MYVSMATLIVSRIQKGFKTVPGLLANMKTRGGFEIDI